MPTFRLGRSSIDALNGVNANLVAVVQRAIEVTTQDFSVHEGVRTLKEQRKMVERGASKTLNSRHLTGDAVDLVPWINGRLRWEWSPIFEIAEAVRFAAQELDVPLRWGGAWDIDFTNSQEPIEDLFLSYADRRRAAGLPVFQDGPHFEIPLAANRSDAPRSSRRNRSKVAGTASRTGSK